MCLCRVCWWTESRRRWCARCLTLSAALCAEAAADSRPGSGRGASSTSRSQHKPVLDIEVGHH